MFIRANARSSPGIERGAITSSSRPPGRANARPMTSSGRKPYAVCSRFGNVADAFLHNPGQGLWVPTPYAQLRARPGRRGWVIAIHTSPHSRDSIRPSFANSSAPKNIEGAGKTGCALHPRSHVQRHTKNAHEHTGSAEAVRPSLRNGFTTYFALSPVRPGLFVTVIPKKLAS
jgi:hypothetical protein